MVICTKSEYHRWRINKNKGNTPLLITWKYIWDLTLNACGISISRGYHDFGIPSRVFYNVYLSNFIILYMPPSYLSYNTPRRLIIYELFYIFYVLSSRYDTILNTYIITCTWDINFLVIGCLLLRRYLGHHWTKGHCLFPDSYQLGIPLL